MHFPSTHMKAEDTVEQLASALFYSQDFPIFLDVKSSGLTLVDKLAFTQCNLNQTLVIVGQGLNFKTIYEICIALQIYNASLELHPMHLKFGQQAFLLRFDSGTFNTELLNHLSINFFIDIFPVSDIKLQDAGLLVMDMDSTVIAMECIDEIAAIAGVKEQVSEVTEKAMRGEIAFSDSLHHRVACLKDINLSRLDEIRQRLPFNPKFLLTMKTLKENGWTLVLASGGFTFFADYIKKLAEIDFAFSNQLEVKDNKLTGRVLGDIVDGERKAQVLRDIAEKQKIPLSKSIAIGDGANDLTMMEASAWSIAYHAKPAVQRNAKAAINVTDFDSLLYMLS